MTDSRAELETSVFRTFLSKLMSLQKQLYNLSQQRLRKRLPHHRSGPPCNPDHTPGYYFTNKPAGGQSYFKLTLQQVPVRKERGSMNNSYSVHCDSMYIELRRTAILRVDVLSSNTLRRRRAEKYQDTVSTEEHSWQQGFS